MTDQDKKLELNKSMIWAQMFFTAIVFSVICFFFWTQIHDLRSIEDALDSKNGMVRVKIQQLDKEIAELDKRVEKVRRANVARVAPEPSGFNLYPDSVPCCGGDESVVTEETVGSIPNDASIEEARRQVIEQMPEETQQMVNDMIHELEEFKATFSEEQLDELEERKADLRRQQKGQMISMIAALPESQRREAQRQLPMMERAMEKPIEMPALMDMEAEQKMREIEEQSRIRRITVTPVTAEQLQEIRRQQQKMEQALEMLEDAARGNGGQR